MADLQRKLSQLQKQSPYSSRVPLGSYATPDIVERFWAKVNKTSECWLWTGSTRKGYGKFHPRHGVTISAPRFAYFLAYGVDPGEMDSLHECDRRRCLRPEHIFLGTAKDNSDDKIAKGRARCASFEGEKNRRSKLTARDVETILQRCKAGETNTSIARDYEVSHHAISRIRLGKSWTGPRTKAQQNDKRPRV
jgi:hypothetical protein